MNILLAILAATALTAPKGKIYNDAPVVTNVNFEGLATTANVGALASRIDDMAYSDLLAVYYPDGKVTKKSQITSTGLEYAYDETTLTATLTNGANAAGVVVIPWKVEKNGWEYTVTAIGPAAFVNFALYMGASITSVIAPTTVKSIGERAFSGCTSLTSISLPAVTRIDSAAFHSCTSLTSISLPAVTRIDSAAFHSCTSLTSISLPAVTNIFGFFGSPPALKTLDFGMTPRDSVPTIDYVAYIEVPANLRIIVPLGMYDEWIAADGWKDLYAQGYKFVGYADAGKVVTAPAVTNIARSVVNSVWDSKLGVAWEARMHDGALYYVAVTNRQEVAE